MAQFKVTAFLIGNPTFKIGRVFNLNNTKKEKKDSYKQKWKQDISELLLQELK